MTTRAAHFDGLVIWLTGLLAAVMEPFDHTACRKRTCPQ